MCKQISGIVFVFLFNFKDYNTELLCKTVFNIYIMKCNFCITMDSIIQ